MQTIQFHKYHALENDFLVVEDVGATLAVARDDTHHEKKRSAARAAPAELVRAICNRQMGAGADGVIIFRKKGDVVRMRVFNADGSEAEVSGNGLRILAHHLHFKNLVRKKDFVIESIGGKSAVRVLASKSNQISSKIELAAPQFACSKIPMKSTGTHFIQRSFATKLGNLVGIAVNVGNPHIVFFVDNFDFDWQHFGREVEVDSRFPQRTNVEFAVIKSRRKVIHCSWERGVGATRASGTGAASTVAAGIMSGLLDHKVTVIEPAGELKIEVPSLEKKILLTGPSVFVAEGTFAYEPDRKNRRRI